MSAKIRLWGSPYSYVLYRISARFQKTVKICEREDDRRGIDIGMERYSPGGLQIAIDRDADGVVGVVNQSERRNGTGPQAEMRHQPLG